METPKITQARLNQYRQELENSATDASDFVRSIVEAYQIAYPEASVTDIKKYTCDAIEDALHVFGGQSCTVANELFEEFAEQAGESVNTQIYDTFDKTYAESKVDYFAQDIVNGNIATFSGNVGAITGFYVKREAFQNMLNNCSKNGIRYARVPSGKETCAFCFMLASRGFVYHTKQSAGEGFGHSYHRHCDCIIVPGFHESTGISADKQIEGYEPSKLYERYKSCLDAVQTPQHTWSADAFNADVRAGKVGADEWEKWKLKRLCAEIDTRDTNWLWNGQKTKTDYSLNSKSNYGELIKSNNYAKENIKNKGNEWRDLWVHHVLEENGIQCQTQDSKNLDLKINGQWWEIKSPETPDEASNEVNELGFIESNIKKATRQFHNRQLNDVRIIFNAKYRQDVNDETMFNEIEYQMKKRSVTEVIYINEKGQLFRLKNETA